MQIVSINNTLYATIQQQKICTNLYANFIPAFTGKLKFETHIKIQHKNNF